MRLDVRDLCIEFTTDAGAVSVVDGVSLSIAAGETVALVGESGCGKTITSLAIPRLLPSGARVTGGAIRLDSHDLLSVSDRDIRRLRGDRLAMIFQEPMTSLNPVLTIGEQIAESLRVHRGASQRQAWNLAVDGLRRVGIPAAERRAADYPHQFSGGMRQRAMIAMALACEPDVLIADEPTTALDVTTQAQILDLLREHQRRSATAILFITHDLGVVAQLADRVYVMYAGRIVEAAPVAELFASPRHPYTQALLRSVPRLESDGETPGGRLPTIPGEVPRPNRRPMGCAFHPRCELGADDEQCRTRRPPLEGIAATTQCACWKAEHQAVPSPHD